MARGPGRNPLYWADVLGQGGWEVNIGLWADRAYINLCDDTVVSVAYLGRKPLSYLHIMSQKVSKFKMGEVRLSQDFLEVAPLIHIGNTNWQTGHKKRIMAMLPYPHPLHLKMSNATATIPRNPRPLTTTHMGTAVPRCQ